MKYLIIASLLLLPAYALAAPDIKVAITAEKIILVEEDGEQVEKRVPTEDVIPGDTLIYTLTYENKGDESATNVELDDPIPENTVYVVGSAFGPGSDISFSIDGGKTFKQPSTLTYEVEMNGKKEKREASPEQYTDIRWTVKEIGVNKIGVASFRVLVK